LINASEAFLPLSEITELKVKFIFIRHRCIHYNFTILENIRNIGAKIINRIQLKMKAADILSKKITSRRRFSI